MGHYGKRRGQIIVVLTTGPAAASWAEEDWQSEAEAFNRSNEDNKDRIHSLGPAPEIKSEDLTGPRRRMEFKRKRYGGDRFEGELKIIWNKRRLEKYAEAVIGERTAHGFRGASLERVVGEEHVSSIEARVKGVNPPLVMSMQAFGNDAEPVHEELVEAIIDIILGAALEASGTSSDCGKAGALTRHLEALRTQHRNIRILDGELEWLLNEGSPDPGKVVEYGRKAERIATEYHAVFRDFKRAETRRGLVEELDLLVETPLLSETGVRPPAEKTPPRDPVEPQPQQRLRHEEAATFSSISPALKALRFYEAGMEGVADGFRDYRATFPRAASRLIWWELHFEYPAPGRRIDFSVEAVYTAPDGREMSRKTLAFNFQSEWTASKHYNGFGYRDRGGWQPGIYRVELFVDGAIVAEGKFYIIE